jgi:hypothetical protein
MNGEIKCEFTHDMIVDLKNIKPFLSELENCFINELNELNESSKYLKKGSHV